MKIRHSLVSNSSSASFVIIWRSINSDINSKDKAIDALSEYNDILCLPHEKESLKNHTVELKPDLYETSFWTFMMNSMADFGPVAAQVMLELYMNPRDFEIVKARTEED